MARTPPSVSGSFLMGNALDFMRRPVELLERGYRQHGPVFSLRLGPKRAAVLIGPPHNEWFFSQDEEILSLREAYKFGTAAFGETLFMAARPVYESQQAFLRPLFSRSALEEYIRIMREQTLEMLDGLGPSGEADLVTLTSRVILSISVRTFLGDEFWRASKGRFEELYRDLAAGLDPLLPAWLPIARFRRRDRARAELGQIFGEWIDRRRRDPNAPDDFFKRLLAMRLLDGSPYSAQDLVNLVTLMIFGSHDTSASALSWTLIHMLQNRSYLERVLAQRDEVMKNEETITPDKLRSCNLLDAALKETERLHPVPAVLTRVVKKPVQVGGYDVPKDWLMIVSPALSHRLPELFAAPDTYDPDRFNQGNNLQQHLIGFGGGMHRCWGRNFAHTEIKILLLLFLGRYDLELATPNPQTDNLQFSRHPLQPCVVRYKRRAVVTREDGPQAVTPDPERSSAA